jgi:uncharacterized protein (TIGR00369 family)
MSLADPPDKQAWLDFYEAARPQTVSGALDIDLVDVDEHSIELRMPITDATRQPMGLLHGGVSMVLAETAASMHACWGIELHKQVPVGIEIGGSHLRSARDGTVRAVGRVVRRARALIVHQVDIYHVESGDHLCTARVTNFYKQIG